MEVRDIPSRLDQGRAHESRRKNCRQFRCIVCNRVFSRKDHLLRHQRAHTEEAPFQCIVCGKRFQRQDILHRHFKDVCDQRAPRLRAGSKKRTAKACNGCRLHKLKCDGAVPCRRCMLKARICSYATDDAPGSNSLRPTLPYSVASGESLAAFSIEQTTPSIMQQVNTYVPISPASFASGLLIPEGEASTCSASAEQPVAGTEASVGIDIAAEFATPFDGSSSSFDFESLEFWPTLDKLYDPFLLNSDFALPFEDSEFSDLNNAEPQNVSTTAQQDLLNPCSCATRPNSAQMPEWLSNLSPNIQLHDVEIINYFLHKFVSHIAPMMPIFRDVGTTADEPPGLLLAMAAVGGLFCPIEGSFQISLAMHTDARRLAMSRALSNDELDMQEAMDLAQMLICLEIFGLCSGDPRTFECTEAQHLLLLQNVEDYSLTIIEPSLTSVEQERRARLIESLCVLESYHVLILQRPAYLSAAIVEQNSSGSSASPPRPDNIDILDDCSKLFTSLMNPQGPLYSPSTSSAFVCCLTLFATVSGNVSSEGKSTLTISWKQDLLELGLYRWLNSYQIQTQGESDLSITPLFHLIFINIRTNLELVHKFARWHACRFEGSFPHLEELQAWQNSDDCAVATSHAKQLVDAIKRSAVFTFASKPRSGSNTPSRLTNQTHTGQKKLAEVPHLATGIYMASLVLWTAALARKKPDWELGSLALENGILVLGCFRVRVATKLGSVLRCLNNSHRG